MQAVVYERTKASLLWTAVTHSQVVLQLLCLLKGLPLPSHSNWVNKKKSLRSLPTVFLFNHCVIYEWIKLMPGSDEEYRAGSDVEDSPLKKRERSIQKFGVHLQMNSGEWSESDPCLCCSSLEEAFWHTAWRACVWSDRWRGQLICRIKLVAALQTPCHAELFRKTQSHPLGGGLSLAVKWQW